MWPGTAHLKNTRWLDLNFEPLELEATALPLEPQSMSKSLSNASVSKLINQFRHYLKITETPPTNVDKILNAGAKS